MPEPVAGPSADRPHAGLLLGRFQPFHLGHLHALRYALGRTDNVLLGIGSSNRAREPSNPYTAQERKSMITGSLDAAEIDRVAIHMIPDLNNHKKWVEMIYRILPPFQAVFTNDEITSRLMTDIRVCPIPLYNREYLSGTSIRARMAAGKSWTHLVPQGTAATLAAIHT